MTDNNLAQAVQARPYPDYSRWWVLGNQLVHFMSSAITSQWRALPVNTGDLSDVDRHIRDYLSLVYGRETPTDLVERFVDGQESGSLHSGEFDALSYAFYASAFDLLAQHQDLLDEPLAQARRSFTTAVGRFFFHSVYDYLDLSLPITLQRGEDLGQFRTCIERVGAFLLEQGYLRDHFAFRFDVDISHAGRDIRQNEGEFVERLSANGVAYALYEMGYPVILPSAVYLYITRGEAQHHSSRTIEELFARAGCTARETDDFDPTGFPADRVVELWEVRQQ